MEKKLMKTSSTINLPVSSKARKPPVNKLEMMDFAHPGNNASRSYMVIPMSHDSPIHSFKKAPVYVSTFGWFLNMQGWSGFQLGESKTPVEKTGYHFLDAHPEVRKWIIIIIIFYPSCMWDIPQLYVGLLTTEPLTNWDKHPSRRLTSHFETYLPTLQPCGATPHETGAKIWM